MSTPALPLAVAGDSAGKVTPTRRIRGVGYGCRRRLQTPARARCIQFLAAASTWRSFSEYFS